MAKGDQGTTRDGDSGQTQEIMPDSEHVSEVPKLSSEMQTAPDGFADLSPERKEELRQAGIKKVQFLEQQYWRFQNGKQEHIECPYCRGKNFRDEVLCCNLFVKAITAILDRQQEIDTAASHVRNLHKVGLVN
jgi:hypothetical protein